MKWAGKRLRTHPEGPLESGQYCVMARGQGVGTDSLKVCDGGGGQLLQGFSLKTEKACGCRLTWTGK